MPSIAEVAGRIATVDAPVLLLDTCILLDIIRSPCRGLRDYASLASQLLVLTSKTPAGCQLIVSSIIPEEWNKNVQNVIDENDKHFERMEDHAAHFHDACEALGIAVAFGRADYSRWKLTESLRDLSKQLMDLAISLDDDAECRSRAYDRVKLNTPPSRKGGGLIDCTIIEGYLAVCHELRSTGFAQNRVFCTSNTNDYCERAPGKPLLPMLASEFDACGLTFTTDLPWAIRGITH